MMHWPTGRGGTAALLLPLLLLAACGQEPDRGELTARARSAGTSPEYVHVTEVSGYRVVPMSAGVTGDHGFGSHYVSDADGSVFELRVDDGSLGTVCPTCERDGGLRYRRTDSARHEYLREADGPLVISAGGDPAAVDREVLRAAVEHARPADGAELDALLPESPGDGAPVERGDLPRTGDGAPVDPEGAGG
ncbi:hypothetical protein [Streptomyces sp. YIM 98790]|uniref:hypothetical protein n=1 Tax=Streptomyces sp. YIM 98790 TaxID=2689077 RepID=UPI00140AE0DC|nr:hypothetical protein [Streptomyces sp. YIM 98790]